MLLFSSRFFYFLFYIGLGPKENKSLTFIKLYIDILSFINVIYYVDVQQIRDNTRINLLNKPTEEYRLFLFT